MFARWKRNRAHHASKNGLEPTLPTKSNDVAQTRDAVSNLEPPVLNPNVAPPDVVPVIKHATALLNWCQTVTIDGRDYAICAPCTLLSHQVRIYYREVCIWNGWDPYSWNTVSAELRQLLGGKKTYGWFSDTNGDRHRLRVFEIPVPRPKRQRAKKRSANDNVAPLELKEAA